MLSDVQKVPVIQTGTFQIAILQRKAKRLYQMKDRSRYCTCSGNIAGILWNLRFHQYNVQ